MEYRLKSRSWGLAFLTLLLVLFCESSIAQNGPYPNRPIKIIIPFPPGNTTDIITRLIAPKLQERLGQSIIVENKAGGSGTIGMDLSLIHI